MTLKDITETLKKITSQFKEIAEPGIKKSITTLLNLVESLVTANTTKDKTIQTLKNEINTLKGEKGTPNIRPQKNNNHSSDKDRNSRAKKKKKKTRGKKHGLIKADRSVICHIDKDKLPPDAKRKGYKRTVVQDLKITTDNIEFQREVYYSASLNRTFTANFPNGYDGSFGPGIKSLSISLYHDCNMTQPALKRFFNTEGIAISKSSVSRMLTHKHEAFHEEKENIIDAGLKGLYQHTDDTSARVNGVNHHVHILSNPFYTAYFTRRKKDRLTLLGILCRDKLKFTLNQESFELMKVMGLSQKWVKQITEKDLPETLTRREIDELLLKLFPNKKKQKSNRRSILEASALGYYHNLDDALKHLMCDDAPQFNLVAEHKSLCWIHEGRHYKKLIPVVPSHKEELKNFSDKFWDFYQKLLDYTENPTPSVTTQLTDEFNVLFSTKTGYDLLDRRIALTLDKKKALLLPLEFSFLPLHNNDAENGAQHQARLRDIHLQTKNELGTKAKDTFATIVKTARKLNVNLFDYFYDRITKSFQMPSLAHIILEKYRLHPNLSVP